MVLGTVFRYGIPLSFVYCTIYQQDIWREADEHLIQEQRRVWRDFFNMIDNGYGKALTTLNVSTTGSPSEHKNLWFLRFSSACWNHNISSTFKSIDQMVSNPKVIACKLYRIAQPYVSSNKQETK